MAASTDRDADEPIETVARASGLTTRTLRHFHAIGLVVPSRTSDGGRRHYDAAARLRLQQVLLLRQTGLPLAEIGAALDRQDPREHVAALGRQLARLLDESDLLDRRIGTVRRTITALTEGTDMSDLDLFDGFDQHAFEAEARERWGEQAVEASQARLAGLAPDEARLARTGFAQVREQMIALHAAGARPADRAVQDVVGVLHRTLCLFWEPDAAAFAGLGDVYVDDERYWPTMGGGDPDVVRLLRDAMAHHAEHVLDREGSGQS